MANKILIIGLGNPGPKYQNSRHNLGFMVLDKLAKEMLPLGKTNWRMDQKANASVIHITPEVIFAKPQTFMNASGFSVRLISRYLNISTSSIWVVYDDVDLPLGKMKIRFGGASAGHHGVESIMQELKTDKFLRFRLGIGRPGRGIKDKNRTAKDVEDYVLEKFGQGEGGETKKMIKKAIQAIQIALKDGSDKAMNRFNS